jgi:hypothetical protein
VGWEGGQEVGCGGVSRRWGAAEWGGGVASKWGGRGRVRWGGHQVGWVNGVSGHVGGEGGATCCLDCSEGCTMSAESCGTAVALICYTVLLLQWLSLIYSLA